MADKIYLNARRRYHGWDFTKASDGIYSNTFDAARDKKQRIIGVRLNGELELRLNDFVAYQLEHDTAWGKNFTLSNVMRYALKEFLDRWETGQDNELAK